MIGQAVGSMVSTRDLEEGMWVSVDHERFEVVSTTYDKTGTATVLLQPPFGPSWPLEVGSQDVLEPMWETV
jgi:hypothetical protein